VLGLDKIATFGASKLGALAGLGAAARRAREQRLAKSRGEIPASDATDVETQRGGAARSSRADEDSLVEKLEMLGGALERDGADDDVGDDDPAGGLMSDLMELRVPAKKSLEDLEAVRRILDDPEIRRFDNVRITGLADHSGRVKPGDLFFAVPGLETDGARFAEDAVEAGAVAIVAARPLDVGVPVVVVRDVRRTASILADHFYNGPSARLPVVGVTGTNGKSTVTDLLTLCLEDDARAVGSLGTIRYRLGELGPRHTPKQRPTEAIVHGQTTTPGPIEVQAYLRAMLDNGVRAAVIEASSHALDQGRTEAVEFSAAVFTNLSQDHLDYHGSMAAYARAKARLFQDLRPGSLAVLPHDDLSAQPIYDALPPDVRLVTYGQTPSAREGVVHVYGQILRMDLRGSLVRIATPDGETEIELPLVGSHNVRNALAAMACAIGMGVGPLRAADALSRARPVSGRLERVDGDRVPFRIFIDYAHTPDAMQQVLTSLRPLTPGKVRVLFGCGGERDRLKRPVMGQIATRLADHVVLTDDNPRRENPEHILSQILEGVKQVETRAAEVEICSNRRQAIQHILESGHEGDIVVLAGKGHEQGQSIGDRVLPFDDKAEVEAWLCSR